MCCSQDSKMFINFTLSGGWVLFPLGFTQSGQFWPNWWKFQGNLYTSSTFRIHWQFAPPYRAFLSYALCTKPGLLRGISRKSAIKLFFLKKGKTIVQGFILNAKLKSLIFWQIFCQKSADYCIFANFDKMAISPFGHLKMRLIFCMVG